jgi:hypothetical protein
MALTEGEELNVPALEATLELVMAGSEVVFGVLGRRGSALDVCVCRGEAVIVNLFLGHGGGCCVAPDGQLV